MKCLSMTPMNLLKELSECTTKRNNYRLFYKKHKLNSVSKLADTV